MDAERVLNCDRRLLREPAVIWVLAKVLRREGRIDARHWQQEADDDTVLVEVSDAQVS